MEKVVIQQIVRIIKKNVNKCPKTLFKHIKIAILCAENLETIPYVLFIMLPTNNMTNRLKNPRHT